MAERKTSNPSPHTFTVYRPIPGFFKVFASIATKSSFTYPNLGRLNFVGLQSASQTTGIQPRWFETARATVEKYASGLANGDSARRLGPSGASIPKLTEMNEEPL